MRDNKQCETTKHGDDLMTYSRQHRLQLTGILTVVGFFLIVFTIVLVMDKKNSHELMENTNNLRGVLEESLKTQVISTSIAAREIINVEQFDACNSIEDVEKRSEDWKKTLAKLRQLQVETDAKYIYAVKQFSDGKYYFLFDTDPENEEDIRETVIEYELEEVHERAFLGKEAAALDMADEYGRYHTGAVPLRKNGKVIGIVSTDVDNTLWDKSTKLLDEGEASARSNFIYLAATIALAMLVMLLLTSVLLRRLQSAQDKLFRLANYDTITGLPNRQYLMNHLAKISHSDSKSKEPFALLFVDLDNFKKVNDNAGHDAGDALLRHIAAYLDGVYENSKLFHPSAGALNVSARVGGDEFIQIFPGISSETDAAIIAQKILDNFRTQALDRYVEKYKIGLSIGIALYPFHSDNYNVLIKYADIAMYHAKREGKNTYRVYEDEMKPMDQSCDAPR
jgi:diguanylate cyclase (GGDEF)-like protein